jgi:hypothetical protein
MNKSELIAYIQIYNQQKVFAILYPKRTELLSFKGNDLNEESEGITQQIVAYLFKLVKEL